MIRNYILDIDYENEPYCKKCESVEQEYTDELGARYIFEFPNGFTAIVVKFEWTLGWEDDLWEMHAFDILNPEAICIIPDCTDDDINRYLSDLRRK